MISVATPQALRAALADQPPRRIGFVPTMGALHGGHVALVDEARRRTDTVVVSIFVNPLQFRAGEDLDRYPRPLQHDLELCAEHGVDLVFVPEAETMYPGGGPDVWVQPGPLGDVLEGAVRVGHFAGVLTVVAKLFNLVQPDVAVFGEKDYQQLVLVRRMVQDLSMPVEVVGVRTVRGASGLALSSRNRYLDDAERLLAATLNSALLAGRDAASRGAAEVMRRAGAVLDRQSEVTVDYLALRSPELGAPPERGPARLLVAAVVGSTRLIDNVAVDIGGAAP